MQGALALLSWFCLVHALPPDKQIRPFHIIKTRSIDLNNAHGLSMETRLDNTLEPTGYQLDLEPYLEDAVFKGQVKINVTWLQDSDEITLHSAHELEITDVEVHVKASDSKDFLLIPIRRASNDPKKPLYSIRLEKTVLKSSTGYINMSFNGNMETTNNEAFFRTSFVDKNEVTSYVAGTQLRPNNARRVFPCFDEPGFKAPFELSIVRPKNLVAFSNTPVERTEKIPDEPNAVRDYFQRTLPMSTYALGLAIADLVQIMSTVKYTDENGNDIELRVFGRQDFEAALEAVPEKAKQVFASLASFWKVPLPLKKLDLVALPNYHGVKSADNWGLIVFKESDLAGHGSYQIAQEIAYQWLGAFTTPAWWTDAHLNKALVNYLAADTAYKINGAPEMEGKWPMTVLYSLYYEYSKRYPHSRITGMKQETTCTKIELLFRMFNYTLGEDVFKAGLRKFLEERKLKTFTGDDIWSALNTAAKEAKKLPSDIDVKTAAEDWINIYRLPLVTVERDYANKKIHIWQKMYLRERPHDVPEADKMFWYNPIVMVRQDKMSFSELTPVAWMKKTKDIDLNIAVPDDAFIIVNPEEIGPFPVNYDAKNWNLLLQYLQSSKRTTIPELTRAKLLHDAWNLAYADELSFEVALNMTLFLKHERNHVVWDPVFTMIDHIGRHLCQCIQGKFQAYIKALLSPLYEELIANEREDEENSRKNLRTLTKGFLCKAGYKPCVKEAQEQYSAWMKAKNPDEGNPIHNRFICPVFKWGSKEEWEFGLQRVINFPSSRKQSERTYLLKTLAGCPISEYKIMRLLNITILEGNTNFTETDLFLIFSMVSGSPEGYTVLFKFLDGNWDVLKQKFSTKTNLWDNLINSATAQFTTQEGLELAQNLFKAHRGEFYSAEHIIEKNIRNIREEAKWSEKNLPVIDKWLDQFLAANKNAAL